MTAHKAIEVLLYWHSLRPEGNPAVAGINPAHVIGGADIGKSSFVLTGLKGGQRQGKAKPLRLTETPLSINEEGKILSPSVLKSVAPIEDLGV